MVPNVDKFHKLSERGDVTHNLLLHNVTAQRESHKMMNFVSSLQAMNFNGWVIDGWERVRR